MVRLSALRAKHYGFQLSYSVFILRHMNTVFLLWSLLLIILLEYIFRRYSSSPHEQMIAFFREIQWLLLFGLSVWFGALLFLLSCRKDLLLVILFLIVLSAHFSSQAISPVLDTFVLLFCATLGMGAKFALKNPAKIRFFLSGIVVFFAFFSYWHLDMTNNFYSGSRWMGLWDNPNCYGLLMGTGNALAIGLLARMKKEECRMKKFQNIFLTVAAGMMLVGLVMSYSRGAWLGTGIGLLYLAWCYGKVKWKYVAVGVGLLALGAMCFWGSTADSAPWYVKRADLGRPSAQHRATAWRAGLEIMRDHPFGVGWNNAVSVYAKDYSPPEGGAAAITTNDYMMIGTELGIAALVCFVAYVGLCFRSPKPKVQSPRSGTDAALDIKPSTLDATKVACRSGALVLLVAFWFDGGLFKLPTAALFWVLLELGAYRAPKVERRELMVKSQQGQMMKAE